MRILLEIKIAGVLGDAFLILAISCGPSSPGIAISAITRSTPPCMKRCSASSPRTKQATRYPRASSMILRWERDCSLSSTHKIVRFGFISLPQSIDRPDAGPANGGFSQYEELQSEMDAKGKRSGCKVPPMPMELSGY